MGYTLFLWRKIKKETGHIKPILNYQKGHSQKIKDLDQLKNYLAQNKDVTVQKVRLFKNLCIFLQSY
ncbi:hypothetical protein [Spiroplasma ixodetis]|uniref:Uncharacterized protein n=1 Tax=Spiroplasma ixodetis TaxID=2141 RepID=A0ABN7BW83_9MOLU